MMTPYVVTRYYRAPEVSEVPLQLLLPPGGRQSATRSDPVMIVMLLNLQYSFCGAMQVMVSS